MAPLRTNREWYEAACRSLVGGVNSPVRSFGSVGGTPVFLQRGRGPYVWDVTGRRYLDLCMSWGALILGHAHPAVVAALTQAARAGTSFGTCTPWEVDLAERVRALFPSLEKLRLVNSGTEATMSAVRVARAYTGRDLVVKFAGCYHGHADGFLVASGSGAATLGRPDSAGVPSPTAALTLVLPFNDVEALQDAAARHGDQIAAIIVEPVAANMSLILPRPGFLATLREVCNRIGAVLIFDEVITGFWVGPGGAQAFYGVQPDLTCLGKALGGGLPIAAYGGRADLMGLVAPEGPVYQAGTLAGNPLAVRAGLAVLELLDESVWASIDAHAARLAGHWRASLAEAGLPPAVNQIGGMLGVLWGLSDAYDGRSAMGMDQALFRRAFSGLLARGVYWPPSPYEVCFLSAAHGESEVEQLAAAFDAAVKRACRPASRARRAAPAADPRRRGDKT